MKRLRFWAYLCAFLSLVISLAMIGFWICGIWELKVVNLNTFIGITVALLGMIVTLAIAWQIYNAVEMRNKIEELELLEDKIKEQEKSLNQLNFSTAARINFLWGVGALDEGQMTQAFRYMMNSLENELQLDNPTNVDRLLRLMGVIVEKISPNTKYIAKKYEMVIESNKKIQSLSNYNLIKEMYDPFYKEFISKVEKNEVKQ